MHGNHCYKGHYWREVLKDLQSVRCYCLCVFNKVNSAEASLPESLLNDVSVCYQAVQVRRCLCGRKTVCLAWTLTKSGHFQSWIQQCSQLQEIKVEKYQQMLSWWRLLTLFLFLFFMYFCVFGKFLNLKIVWST